MAKRATPATSPPRRSSNRGSPRPSQPAGPISPEPDSGLALRLGQLLVRLIEGNGGPAPAEAIQQVTIPSPPPPPRVRAGREKAPPPPSSVPEVAPPVAAKPEDPPQPPTTPSRPRLSAATRQYADLIEQTLADFGAPVRVVHAETGPMLLRFGVAPGYLEKPARGDQPARRERVRAAKIVARSNDLALALGVTSLRIEAPVPGKTYIGIEIPNPQPKSVPLNLLLEEPTFQNQVDRGVLPIALGRDVAGQPIFADLARLPHLLIAGATGAGKSVAVNSLLGVLLKTRSPADVRLLVVDPKRVEFTWLAGTPHLLAPVVTESEKAIEVLGKAETEMAHRYDLLAAAGSRNRLAYNATHKPGLPALVIIIDELADLMILASDDVERSICRIAQLGRAAGLHLIVATQRPSVDVVTGLIKANLPARLAFAVSSMIDSRTILDQPGAERLLGRGDFLFLAPDAMRPIRGQGALARDSWLAQLVRGLRTAVPPGTRDPEAERFARLQSAAQIADGKLYQSARQLADEHPKISASYFQRKLRIGYPKAEALIERLRADGILDDPDLEDD
jgi:DNA segregation ATPase FtsK/SpoIIIE, S-DNA-T family